MAEREQDPAGGPLREDPGNGWLHAAADHRTGILLADPPRPSDSPLPDPRLPDAWTRDARTRGSRVRDSRTSALGSAGPAGPPEPSARITRAVAAPERGASTPGGYNPALDGIRALAVLAVLVFHMDSLPGGYLGVDVFFVLSGFLITGQLLAEWDRTGRVSLARFYLRRAFRLLPAFWLLALVAFTAVVLLGIGTGGERSEFLRSLASSMLYLNNYFQVADQSTGAGWLGHTWSLSLEEQFYLLWPLLLIALCRWPWLARRLPVVLLGGVVMVALWRNVLMGLGASGTRAYFGLDTRADALLVGCALAAWLRAARRGAAGEGRRALAWRRRLGRLALVVPVAGPVAFALLAVATVEAPDGWGPRATSMSRGGFTVVALLAGTVVLAVEVGVTKNWLSRALSVRPLAWLGRISYGFYLWHFPVVAHFGVDLADDLGRWPAVLAVALISVAVASASYYLLERPIQRRCPAWPRQRPFRATPSPRTPALAGSRRLEPWDSRVTGTG